MDSEELKQMVAKELIEIDAMIPSHLAPDDLVPEDVKAAMKKRTEDLLHKVENTEVV